MATSAGRLSVTGFSSLQSSPGPIAGKSLAVGISPAAPDCQPPP